MSLVSTWRRMPTDRFYCQQHRRPRRRLRWCQPQWPVRRQQSADTTRIIATAIVLCRRWTAVMVVMEWQKWIIIKINRNRLPINNITNIPRPRRRRRRRCSWQIWLHHHPYRRLTGMEAAVDRRWYQRPPRHLHPRIRFPQHQRERILLRCSKSIGRTSRTHHSTVQCSEKTGTIDVYFWFAQFFHKKFIGGFLWIIFEFNFIPFDAGTWSTIAPTWPPIGGTGRATVTLSRRNATRRRTNAKRCRWTLSTTT